MLAAWKKTWSLLSCLFLLGQALPGIVLAQDKPVKEEGLVVTATKTGHSLEDVPVKTEVITRKEIENKKIKNLQEVLKGIPGLKEFKLIDPEGKTKELKPNPGGFLATEIRVKHKGTFLVSAVKNPGFYTMYKKNGQIHHKSTPKNAIKADIEEVVLSHYFEESAKSLINVGQAEVKRLKQPLGHTLEILCLKNPRELKVGEMLPIKVLFKEKPAQFVQALATYSSFSTEDDFAFATKTNHKGEARIKILHQGNWLIKAWKKMPAIAEYRNKCNQMSYSATFTFSIE